MVQEAKSRNAEPVHKRSGTCQLLRRETRYMKKCNTNVNNAKITFRKERRVEKTSAAKRATRDTLYQEHLNSKVQQSATNEEQVLEAGEVHLGTHNPSVVDQLIDNAEDHREVISLLAEDQERLEHKEEVPKTEESDTTGNRIMAFTLLTKRLLLSDISVDRDIGHTILSAWKGNKKPTARELEVISTCIKLLKPYVPDENAPRCVMLHLPLILLSNIVQRVAGYATFTREICPYISPASIQALPLNACAALYDAMSSSSFPNGFVLRDRQDVRITSADWAMR